MGAPFVISPGHCVVLIWFFSLLISRSLLEVCSTIQLALAIFYNWSYRLKDESIEFTIIVNCEKDAQYIKQFELFINVNYSQGTK